MADFVFNVAKGRGVEFYNRVKSNDPSTAVFKVALLKIGGLESDDLLNNYDDWAALLAASNDEADFTNYVANGKVLTDGDLAALPAPDDTNNRRDIDLPDQTWTSAGGASNNSLGKAVVVYYPDTGGATSTGIPVAAYDFVVTTTGIDLVLQFSSAGFYRAS